MIRIDTKKLAVMAMLIALQVVLSKFLMIMAAPSVRLSVDSVPILLAGIWFGPLSGLIVGTLSDLVGTVLFPTAGAYYPPLTLAFALIGLSAGLIGKPLLKTKHTLPRIALIVGCSELVGSILYKTFALSLLYGTPFWVLLGARILPALCVAVADSLLVYALDRLLHQRMAPAPTAETILSSEDATEMNYDEALTYIHSVTWRGSRLGLARTRTLLALVGDPQKSLRFVHIAGTNGKGSTLAMLSSILKCAGYRTGSYSSPFIDRFNERMQIDGVPISDEELAKITSYVRPIADGMADHPTEFEMITAIAMLYYKAHACEIVVLEVGLGGRLDSTNAIDTPELAVITNIGLDHTRELGPTIADIARAKAGIIKEGGNVVIYGQNAEADAIFAEACREQHAKLITADHARVRQTGMTLDALTFDFLPDLCGLTCPLVGSYQLDNAAVALTAVEALRGKGWAISDQAVREGMAHTKWPARFEILSRDPLFIGDGGHNPQGVAAALNSLSAHFPGKKAVFLLGIMADKDVPNMLAQIIPYAQCAVAVAPDNPRAMPAAELAQKVESLGCTVEICGSVAEGVARAKALAGPDGIAFALGSLYMLGDVRACFGGTRE